jgi:hypothetical protein
MSRLRRLLALALLVAIAGVTASPAQAAITSRGLLFRLDSKNPASYPGSGTAWKDLSGNGYDVTLVNGANTTCSVAYAGSETCASGSAETVTTGVRMPTMQFYNQTAATTGKYGVMKNGSSFSFGAFSGFSLTFYANFGTATGNWDRIVDFGNGADSDNILIGRNNATTTLSMELWHNNISYGYCSANVIGNNTWAFYAIVADGTNCYIYKDSGTKNTTNAYTGLPTSVTRTYNYIARSNWSGDGLFSGGIADLAMYNVALNDTEVATNYTEQTSAQLLSISSTAPNNATFGGANYTITDTSTSQLAPVRTIDPASTSVCSISGSVVSFIGVGTCKINFTQPGSVNYSAAAALSQSFSVTGSATLNLSIAANATYRQALGVSASVNTAGKVTFYSQGKAIPGCKNLAATTTATCNWKPSQHGTITLSAQFLPSNNTLTAQTKQTLVTVNARSGNR